MGRVTARRRVQHVTADDAVARPDTLVVEEPLEIRVNGKPLTVTMRTPGSDVELAQGFLLTEGVIARRDDVLTVRYCKGAGPDQVNTYNVLDVTLAPDVPPPDVDVTRNFYTTSSCGVCGKASLDAVRTISKHCPGDDPVDRRRRNAVGAARPAARPSRRCSPAPAACTAPRCSTPTAPRWWCARTSAATTPSTRSSAGRWRTTGYR